MRARPLLWFGLASAAVFYALSRTRRGSEVVDEGIVLADIAGSLAMSAVKSLRYGYSINNPGNIRWIEKPASRWRGMIENDNGYAKFDTPENGARALGKQLLAYEKRGLRSVEQIISTWAPSTENNTRAYIAHVCQRLNVTPGEFLNVSARLVELSAAIALHENGYLAAGWNFDAWVRLP